MVRVFLDPRVKLDPQGQLVQEVNEVTAVLLESLDPPDLSANLDPPGFRAYLGPTARLGPKAPRVIVV